MPAVTVRLAFLGAERSANFSLATPFENNDSPFGGDGGSFAQSDLLDLVDIDIFDMRDDIGGMMARAAGLYLTTFLLLIAVLIFVLIDKLKKLSFLLHLLSIGLFIYSGRTMLSVPEIIFERIENLLGFFAMFINIRGMLQMSLGAGYWVTLVCITCAFLVRIVFLVHPATKAPIQELDRLND